MSNSRVFSVDTCKVHLVIERGEDGRTIVCRTIVCYLNACNCRLRGACSGLRGIVQGAIRGHRDSPMPWSRVHATNTTMSCREVEKHKYCRGPRLPGAGLNPARREGDSDSRRTWLGVMADRSRSRTLLAKSRGAINTEATPCGDSTRLALTAVFHLQYC